MTGTSTIHLHRVPSFSCFSSSRCRGFTEKPNLQRTSCSSIASIVPLLSSRCHDVTTSRRHGRFQPRNSATMNAEESSKIFWHLSCAQEQSLPSLDIQTKQTLSKILKALTSSSSVIIERSNLSSCKPILNYCDVGLTIVIIAFGKTKKLVRSSCDP